MGPDPCLRVLAEPRLKQNLPSDGCGICVLLVWNYIVALVRNKRDGHFLTPTFSVTSPVVTKLHEKRVIAPWGLKDKHITSIVSVCRFILWSQIFYNALKAFFFCMVSVPSNGVPGPVDY